MTTNSPINSPILVVNIDTMKEYGLLKTIQVLGLAASDSTARSLIKQGEVRINNIVEKNVNKKFVIKDFLLLKDAEDRRVAKISVGNKPGIVELKFE